MWVTDPRMQHRCLHGLIDFWFYNLVLVTFRSNNCMKLLIRVLLLIVLVGNRLIVGRTTPPGYDYYSPAGYTFFVVGG